MRQSDQCTPIFPYTTLFRSNRNRRQNRDDRNHDHQFDQRKTFLHTFHGGSSLQAWSCDREGGCPLSPCPGSADRKSTRLNSSHVAISYAVFCLKTKIYQNNT